MHLNQQPLRLEHIAFRLVQQLVRVLVCPKRTFSLFCWKGPKPETVDDFWLMVWNENISVIAMIVLTVENGKVSCESENHPRFVFPFEHRESFVRCYIHFVTIGRPVTHPASLKSCPFPLEQLSNQRPYQCAF